MSAGFDDVGRDADFDAVIEGIPEAGGDDIFIALVTVELQIHGALGQHRSVNFDHEVRFIRANQQQVVFG